MIFPGLIKDFTPVQGIYFDPVLLAFQARVSEYFIDGRMEPLDVTISRLSLGLEGAEEKCGEGPQREQILFFDF
jgi:hypothetical protein